MYFKYFANFFLALVSAQHVHLSFFCVLIYNPSSTYYMLKKRRLKITQLEKGRFIKVNELKLTQVELISFFHFKCVAANASELFCMAHLENNKCFL